jgi:hypothetical protein
LARPTLVFDARSAAGRPARKTSGLVPVGMNGIPSTQVESVPRASTSGLQPSAFRAPAGPRIRIGMPTTNPEQLSCPHSGDCLQNTNNILLRDGFCRKRLLGPSSPREGWTGHILGDLMKVDLSEHNPEGRRLRNQFAALLLLHSLISTCAFSQQSHRLEQSASVLLKILLSPHTSDYAWNLAERQFEALPTEDAIRALFPEIAKGMPGGGLYGIYNCFDPLHDRRLARWGEYCVANWLWCKQLSCPQRREKALKMLLELWPHATSLAGRMALLQELCRDPEAEAKIAALFTDSLANARLRTEAGVCLLYQDEAKYHREVVAFAEQSPPNLRQLLFNKLAYPSQAPLPEVDPAVIRMGFALLFEEADKQANARRNGQIISDYAQFLYASRLGAYLNTRFEPDQKSGIYMGTQGIERGYHDSVMNALDWWSKHNHD